MANELYLEQKPGDLITAENWNELQRRIKAEIQDQVAKAKEAVKKEGVDKAGNADKLENKNTAQLKEEFLKAAEQLVAKRTGYRSYFRWINNKEDIVIEHQLLDYPVVDVYELEKIHVICSEDKVLSEEDVLFYLHHSSEMSLSKKLVVPTSTEKVTIDMNFSTPFAKLLEHYGITPTADETLDALESRFWDEFFSKNGEDFDPRADDATCHSPWFDRCCGDHRTYDQLKKAGDWDKLMFHVKPRKTINYTVGTTTEAPAPRAPLPALVQVSQYTFNKIGIRLWGATETLPVLIILKV